MLSALTQFKRFKNVYMRLLFHRNDLLEEHYQQYKKVWEATDMVGRVRYEVFGENEPKYQTPDDYSTRMCVDEIDKILTNPKLTLQFMEAAR